jgi:electron transport complex protein RnfG
MAYPAKMNGELVGVAIESYTMTGFSGLVKLMVGLKSDGSIYSISVLEHKETPGLGTHMAEDKFINQFKTQYPSTFKVKVKKDGGDVDAITAATISSRAFCDAVMRAYNAYMQNSNNQTSPTDTVVVAQTEGGVE